MDIIKPIETVYKGYKFRSRLEARWAVFFDALGLEWEYEPEGFDLGEAGYYLPDFLVTFIGGAKWFAEVKGQTPSEADSKKIAALDDNPPDYAMGVIRLIGTPEDTVFKFSRDDNGVVYLTGWEGNTSMLAVWNGFNVYQISAAVIAARQARFEHGERPQL